MTLTKKFLASQIAIASLSCFIPTLSEAKLAATLLLGGSTFNAERQNYIVFPANSFRTDSFTISNNQNNFAQAIGLAYDFTMNPQSQLGCVFSTVWLGANIYYYEGQYGNTVLEYSLPAYNNSTYDLRLASSHFMLDSEWDIRTPWRQLVPFFEVGIGAARNTLTFNNDPLPNIGATGGKYTLRTNVHYQFAYDLGLGLKVPVCPEFIVSLRYLYSYAGQAQSSTYDGVTGVSIAKPLTVNVSSQSIFFGMSYLFG